MASRATPSFAPAGACPSAALQPVTASPLSRPARPPARFPSATAQPRRLRASECSANLTSSLFKTSLNSRLILWTAILAISRHAARPRLSLPLQHQTISTAKMAALRRRRTAALCQANRVGEKGREGRAPAPLRLRTRQQRCSSSSSSSSACPPARSNLHPVNSGRQEHCPVGQGQTSTPPSPVSNDTPPQGDLSQYSLADLLMQLTYNRLIAAAQ